MARSLSVTQDSALSHNRALQQLFESGLPLDEPQVNVPSIQHHKAEQDLLQQKRQQSRDAERHKSSATTLKLPHEVVAMVCSHMSEGDMFSCLMACKALYLAVIPHLWRALRLRFTKCKISEEVRKRKEAKDSERREHKERRTCLRAVGISRKTRRHRVKEVKQDPRVSKTFEGFRINVLRPRNRLNAMVAHIRELIVKEPYEAWSEQAFARTFEELLPKDFHFSTNMTCSRYESIDSNVDQNSMVDTLQVFCRLLPPQQTIAPPESDHTSTQDSKREWDADDSKDNKLVKLQRTEDTRDTSEGVQGNTVNHHTCIHGVRMGDSGLNLIPRCFPCFDKECAKEKYSPAMKYMSKVLQEFRPHIIGSIISRLELHGLATVGVTFVTQLTVLFPNVTNLVLCTGGPNASARWKLGQCLRILLRVFSQFRHLRILKTNFTVDTSLRANTLNSRHNPIPPSPNFHETLRPVYQPGRNPGNLARPMHHVPLYLDRLPRQMVTVEQAMVCQDQWLRTHKRLLQEFAREWLWVQRNGMLEKSSIPLRSVTCLFGDLMKQEITFEVELDNDPQDSHGTKFTADLPDDILKLGIRDYTKSPNSTSGSKSVRGLKKLYEEYAVLKQNLRVRNWHTCYERDVYEGIPRPLDHLDLVHVRGTFNYEGWYKDHGGKHVEIPECEVRNRAEMDRLYDEARERVFDVLATVNSTPEHWKRLEDLFMMYPLSQLTSD